MIWFSTAMGGWTWDIARIQEQQLTDNVVELMAAKLRQLPAETLQILELAACIGFRFPLRLLAMVSGRPPGVAADNLQPAVREGLIAPIGDAYQLVELELMNQDFEVTVEFAFAHDRIQQAAYFLLAKARRPEAHLRIGRLFKQTIQSSQRSPEQLFEMTNHLNLGSSLINEPGERLELCRLNIAAGQQARQANAYAACLNYFKEALNLLDEKYRRNEYELTLEVYSGAAEAAYLCGAYDTMDELVETGLALAQDLSGKVAFYLVWISACMARGQLKVSSLTTLSGSHANVDIGALIKALKTIAEETVHSRMVEVILSIAMQFAGAQHGMLLLRNQDGRLFIEAEASSEGFDASILQSVPVTEGRLSQAVVNYVARTRSNIVINDAGQPGEQVPGLVQDPHIQAHNVRSVLCLPLLSGSGEEGELIGMIYLENNLATDTFTRERFGTLEIIGMSAAGRLELSRKAVIDGLTELFNHDYFQNLLIKEFESARRHGLDLALILIDIDNFKVFNDTWGHQLGDQVLREVARLIRISCRQGDTVARYGGEEMAVILPMADLEAAHLVAERIRLAVDNNGLTHGSEQLSVTISLGLAVMDSFTTNKDILISRADAALYRSKANGRNQTTVG